MKAKRRLAKRRLRFVLPEQVGVDELGIAVTSVAVEKEYVRAVAVPPSRNAAVNTQASSRRAVWKMARMPDIVQGRLHIL